MNREGYITSERLLSLSRNENVRQYGGVVALLASAALDLELTIDVTQGDAPGHVEIRQLNRRDYDRKEADGSRPGKQRIQELADKLIRLGSDQLQIRKLPTSKPKS